MATAPPLLRPVDGTAAWPTSWARVVSASRPPLDLQRVVWDALVIIALLLINKGGNAGAAVFFAIMTCMVIWSPRAALKALAIAWLGLMVNTAFVPKSLVWTPARLALPLIAYIRFSLDMQRISATLLSSGMYVAFLGYVIVMAVCSIMSGLFTLIALIKLANFWAVVSAILSGVAVLRRMRIDMTEWFVSLIAAATLLGVASIALGVDNNFRSFSPDVPSNAFVGAFLHPNCHSVYAALFVVLLATVFLLGDYPRRLMTLPMMGIWAVFMYWSKARASVLATVIGLLALLLLARPFKNRFHWRLRINVPRSQIMAGLVLVTILVAVIDLASGGYLSREIVSFINKGGGDDGNVVLDTEQVLLSRAGLMNLAWKNFLEHPIFGIGFQVSTTQAFAATATLFTAPVEKGVIAYAVLEEGGFVGATAFIVFLLVMIAEFVRSRNVPALAMLAAFLASNMGEVTFFSPGGSGAFGWMMIGAAMILGDHCWRSSHTSVTARAVPRAKDSQRQ